MNVPRDTTQKADASRANPFTLPPEPVVTQAEREQHDKLVDPPNPIGNVLYVPAEMLSGPPHWLTARPAIFALGTAAGALFVLLLRGWT